MDAHHGFSEPAYVRFLNEYDLKLQAAEPRKAQHPEMGPSRDITIMQLMFQQAMPPTNPIHSKFQCTSILPPAYAPSICAFGTLKRSDDVGHVIADDKDRDVAQVELHNREAEITTDGRLAEGTVMIIKEPYLKAMPDGEYTIRVDHVSEIVFRPILPSSCMDTGPSANDWKVAGNEKFVKGKYYLAKTESCVLFPGDSPV